MRLPSRKPKLCPLRRCGVSLTAWPVLPGRGKLSSPRMGTRQETSDGSMLVVMYGRDEGDWEQLADAGLAFLVERARLRKLTSYTELNATLVRRTGLPGFDFGRADAGQRRIPRPAGFFAPAMCPSGPPFRARLAGATIRASGPDINRPALRFLAGRLMPRGQAGTGWAREGSRPLSRDRTRCPRYPASRGTTRCRHRQAAAARVPRRARPAVRIRPQVRPGALHPRARCRPARQDAAGS